jgi:hypothetical protein
MSRFTITRRSRFALLAALVAAGAATGLPAVATRPSRRRNPL